MKAVYIFSQIARFTASLFSIAGGFIYTQKTVSVIIDNGYSALITAILLTILEAGTIVFVYTAFRIILFKKTFPVIYIIPALGFLTITFILTTNGAVMWLRQETDIKKEIQADLIRDIEIEKDSISILLQENKLIYDSLAKAELHEYKTAREMQTEKLRFYASEISRLQKVLQDEKTDKRTIADMEIRGAEQKFTDNKEKYWWLAFIIMSAVVYFNFLTAFLEYKKRSFKQEPNISPKEKTSLREEKQSDDELKTKIILLKKTGMKQIQISKELNINPSKISRILNGKK